LKTIITNDAPVSLQSSFSALRFSISYDVLPAPSEHNLDLDLVLTLWYLHPNQIRTNRRPVAAARPASRFETVAQALAACQTWHCRLSWRRRHHALHFSRIKYSTPHDPLAINSTYVMEQHFLTCPRNLLIHLNRAPGTSLAGIQKSKDGVWSQAADDCSWPIRACSCICSINGHL
jgi:hypothetical protein